MARVDLTRYTRAGAFSVALHDLPGARVGNSEPVSEGAADRTSA